jgi:polyhydroxyalkanoate synthase
MALPEKFDHLPDNTDTVVQGAFRNEAELPKGGQEKPQAPPVEHEPDSYSAKAYSDFLDHAFRASVARASLGLSPAAMWETWADWAVHLASAPGKQQQLLLKALRKNQRFWQYAVQASLRKEDCATCIEPLVQDKRFRYEGWQRFPFNLYYQAFLLNQQWWHNATSDVPGVSRAHERALQFVSRQLLDVVSPSNNPLTNPEVIDRTRAELGQNFVRGFQNFWEDWERKTGDKRPPGADAFRVGRDVAVTPGKVVYRNRLIELIQYAPATSQVHPEPLLIVPAWIMKYYILDLSPENSLVKYLVGQGFTVFTISWKNPGPDDRDLSLDDYRQFGVMDALDAIGGITSARKTHLLGYCLGGTLASIAAAAMSRDDDDRLASLTLLAAETDFSEAGELMLFINESQVRILEDLMWEQGFLDTSQMSGAFQLLRSNDLIWSKLLREYLLGERAEMNDLMAWNSDGTRMPYRMHSEYLRKMFLENALSSGKYLVEGRPISLGDIRMPIFAVGTETDHVAPWRSVYKIHALTDTDVSFVLTNGGHNAGAVSEPGHPHRHHRLHHAERDARFLSPDEWLAAAEYRDGSWWPTWIDWLKTHSGKMIGPPSLGGTGGQFPALCDAPGTYVKQP